MRKFSKIFAGMDVHEESIDITLAKSTGEVRRRGQIGRARAALAKAVRNLESWGNPAKTLNERGRSIQFGG